MSIVASPYTETRTHIVHSECYTLRMKPVDFLAIGDPVVDEFIRLKDATVHCNINSADCTISMRWGDKIPFESSTLVAGVGNSANAAVSARRLGLSSALLGITGKDRYGDEIKAVYEKEGMDTSYISQQAGIPTNHHYVLSYEGERTILIKHEEYVYEFPKDLPPPKTLYLSSFAETVKDEYYDALIDFLEAHPDVQLAFQPGTFQIKMGTKRLARVYARTNIFFCNKEEAGRILETDNLDIKTLLSGMHALGPKLVVITDGPQGAYASDGSERFQIPMYPDPKPPYERTGAGDACSSTIASALTLGLSFEEALLWGPINSMAVVQKLGAQAGLLTRTELEKLLSEKPKNYLVSPLA